MSAAEPSQMELEMFNDEDVILNLRAESAHYRVVGAGPETKKHYTGPRQSRLHTARAKAGEKRVVGKQGMMGRMLSPYPSHLAPFLGTRLSPLRMARCVKMTGYESDNEKRKYLNKAFFLLLKYKTVS